MTNFEKWKSELTAEKILNAVKRVQKVGRSSRFCCFCPAQHSCSAVNDEECNEHIMAWANADVDDITPLLAEVARLTDLAAKIALSHPVGSPEYDLAFCIWSQNVAVANRTPAAYHRAIRAVKGASLPAKENEK